MNPTARESSTPAATSVTASAAVPSRATLEDAHGGNGARHADRRIARRRAGARLGFLIHVTVYVVVNLALIAIDLLTSPQVRWAHYPLLGWGLGVAIHGLVVHLLPFAATVHARLTERELKRMQG